jgi:hypothetical protein
VVGCVRGRQMSPRRGGAVKMEILRAPGACQVIFVARCPAELRAHAALADVLLSATDARTRRMRAEPAGSCCTSARTHTALLGKPASALAAARARRCAAARAQPACRRNVAQQVATIGNNISGIGSLTGKSQTAHLRKRGLEVAQQFVCGCDVAAAEQVDREVEACLGQAADEWRQLAARVLAACTRTTTCQQAGQT